MYMLTNRSENNKPSWDDNEVNDFLQLYYTELGPQNIKKFFGRLVSKGSRIYYASPALPGLNFSNSELVISDTLTYDNSGLQYKNIVIDSTALTNIGNSINELILEGTNKIGLLPEDLEAPFSATIDGCGYSGDSVYFIFRSTMAELLTGTKYYLRPSGLDSKKLWSIFSFMLSDEVRILSSDTDNRQVGKLIAEPYSIAYVLAMEFTETIPENTPCICRLME